ncbi:Crp/Fnr family transcriptional regulator [Sphingomonas nostoxanthinifaciens]|uniref:Crp/Fnr family transcriptional regulator n=1 Tax=Sphingomonas nostoxanthinifaciens TaxID=2872652 RepID=UPI001CC2125F|nr:Crp/Fnr family transcriptional regulator [Sphingomonas nostoxanthinifaciens]UAK25960.1 Crp/Fnr family transcriptional regulator [Sphingomonas nostoxanthinifaciens]
MADQDPFPPHRLFEFVELTAAERQAIDRLHGPVVRVPKGQQLRRAGEPVVEIFFLIEGWAISSLDLAGGERQIVKVHLPGDLLGTPSMVLETAAETLTAITPIKVSRVSLTAFGQLFHDAPRLSIAMFMSAQQERIMLMDRVASLGRSSAVQRVASFVLHVYDRLRVWNPEQGPKLYLPLTQENIGDVTGLTAVHVNRILRQMNDDGLLVHDRQCLTLLDIPKLRTVGALPERRWCQWPEWLDRKNIEG